MDIHKPKAWHGVREFLKELATIVLGVLIAIGGEQGVEWLHRGSEVREARAALHVEMSRNLRTVALKAREDGCWLGAIAAYEAWAKGTRGKPVWPQSMMQSLASAVWEVARTGAVPHMDLDERVQIAGFYSAIENEQDHIREHRRLATEFAGYRNRDSLDPEEAHALIRVLGQVGDEVWWEQRNALRIQGEGRKLGLGPGPPVPDYEARVDHMCAAFPAPSAGAGG